MSSRSLMPGRHSRSRPSSWLRNSTGPPVRNRIRPPTPTGSGRLRPAARRRASGEPSLPSINTWAIDAHIKYLADDLLEGRAPATRGGRLAAKYVAAAFQALGLEPGGPSGSYFQPVALVGMTPQPTLAWGKG